MRRFVFAGLLLAATSPIVLAQDADIAPMDKAADVQTESPNISEPAHLAIYKPIHLPASEMALLVRESMGESVRVTVEPTRNQLLIRASQAQHEQIQAVLKALDQPAKTITFEVTFADLPAQAGGEPNKERASSEDAWLARLKTLEDGAKGNVSRLRLSAVENQKAMVQFGGQTPIVTGVNRGFGRGGQERSAVVQQTHTGTIVQCTARVLENDTIIAELEIERSRLAPESGAVLDESDDRAALRTPGHLTTTCKTTVKLQPGKPHLLSGQTSQTGTGSTLNLIVITAELPREK